jgi:hypothetical protein
MAIRQLLGIFQDPEQVFSASNRLKEDGIPAEDLDVYSGSPYPEGSFGEHIAGHRLYVFPIIGAICGFAVAILLTAGTQISYPLITGGKPILSIPPMTIITYEGTMLGALLFTVLGILFESRLPKRKLGLYDPRITEGYIGLVVNCSEDQMDQAERTLTEAGAEEVQRESEEG